MTVIELELPDEQAAYLKAQAQERGLTIGAGGRAAHLGNSCWQPEGYTAGGARPASQGRRQPG
jgi:hypothetical protein